MAHPLDIKDNFFLKCIIFASLYFSEGIMIALETVIVPLYFVDKGISLPIIGLVVGITNLPWVFKFIFGGITDKFRKFGRRPFIFFGGLIGALSIVAMAFVDPALALIPFSILLFISRCGIVFLDVSSDGMAIEVTKPRERGKVNGFMFAGQFLGMAFGAFLLPLIAFNFSYKWAFIATGILIVVVIILPLLARERVKREKSAITKTLLLEFKRKIIWVLIILLPLTTLSIGLLETIMPPYMKLSIGLDISTIGTVALFYSLAMAVGSIVGGFFSDKYGRKRSLFVVLSVVAIASFFLISTKDFVSISIVWAIIGLTQGALSSIGCALAMDYMNPKIGATQFSIMTGFFNLGATVGATVSGISVALFGFKYAFVVSAVIYIPAIIFLLFIRFKEPGKVDILPKKVTGKVK